MKKSELVDAVAAQTGHTKIAVVQVLESVLAQIKAADSVLLAGFGKFEKKNRAARVGRNPQSGAAVNIPAKIVFTFKASKA